LESGPFLLLEPGISLAPFMFTPRIRAIGCDMDTFTVYLFVRDRSAHQSPLAITGRLQALQALREELVALGVRVTALPFEADLQVEITNVIGLKDEPCSATGRGQAERVLIIRLLIANEPVEFVCSDGIGQIPAERHAARRVLVWLNNLTTYQNRPGREGYGALTVNLSTN
jgi:hypothetical protein